MEDTRDVLTVHVAASMMILLHINPYAIFHALYDPDDDCFNRTVRPIVDTAIRLARVASEYQPDIWRPEFFSEHADDLLSTYAIRHPESGLGVPDHDQWQAFIDELGGGRIVRAQRFQPVFLSQTIGEFVGES